MANDLRSRLEAKEFPTASPGILVDDAIAVFREWLESELARQMITAVKEGKSDEILSYLNDRLTAVQDALAANLEPEGTEDE